MVDRNDGSGRWKRIVNLGNGYAEVEEYYAARRGKKSCRRSPFGSTARDQAIINERNAEDRLRWLITANFKQGDLHLSLTYRKDDRPTFEESKKRVREFNRLMRNYYKKQGKEYKYIWTTEKGKRGAIHHHFILEYMDLRITQSFWKWGKVIFNSCLDKSESYGALAWYLIKGNRKAFNSCDYPSYKRYNAAKCLKQPVITYKRLKAAVWRDFPKSCREYEVLKWTYDEGIHGLLQTPWRRYMIKFNE